MRLRILSRRWQRDIAGERGSPVFPAVAQWVTGVGVRTSGGVPPSHVSRMDSSLVVSQPQCDQWSSSHGLFSMNILLHSPLAHPGALILCAHSPPSSLSLVALPTGTSRASGHLPNQCSTLTLCPHAGHPLWLTYLLGLQRLLPACWGLQASSGLTNQLTSLPFSRFNYIFCNDVIKTQLWGEPQPWGEGPLPRSSFLASCPSDLGYFTKFFGFFFL